MLNYPTFSLNAGFGRRSHSIKIVRELSLDIGDDLEWLFDEETGEIVIRVVYNDWESPDWIKP